MLVGEDVMRPRVATHYAPLFRLGDQLLNFAEDRLFADLTEGSEDRRFVVGAVYTLTSASVKIFRSIHHLAEITLDETAFMLLRPLAESWAFLGWILETPAEQVPRAKLYLAGEITERYRWFKHCVDEGITEGLPPRVVANPGIVLEPLRQSLREEEGSGPDAIKRAEQRLQKMVNRDHWAPVSTKEMFRATEQFLDKSEGGLGHTFGFKLGSGVLHGRHPGLFAIVSEDVNTISPNFLADDKYIGWTLFISDLFLASLFDLVNRGLDLGIDAEIQGFMKELLALAREPRKPLGQPML